MNQGETIGHYKIIRQLGKGGMGEVYLAADTKLQREVALKFLPENVRGDSDRLARFRREALAAAKLKHPNIATIYALEDFDGHMFIAMEYVEGDMLSSHIQSDGMALDKFFDIFLPLADGLAHAHGQGRIHRDLKPGNIMVTPDGIPKILDYGLALIEQREAGSPEMDSDVPTRTMKTDDQAPPSLTQGKSFLGTPAYMSPEQIEGKKVDSRSDIFSLGVVMYEAITGKKPFKGNTVESIIGRILTEEPKAVSEMKPITPHTLWWNIRQCLKKDREQRLQTARQLHTALKDVLQEVQSGIMLVDASTVASTKYESVPIPFWRQSVGISAIVLMTLIIGVMGTWFFKPSSEIPLRKSLWPAEENNLNLPAISPDGTMVAYISDNVLWVRDLRQLEPRQISDIEVTNGVYQAPFWSPGSDYIGYLTQNELRKVAVQSGQSTTLCKLPVQTVFATWKLDGTILFSQDGVVYNVSAQGGEPAVYLRPDSTKGEKFFSAPHILPNRQTVILARRNLDGSSDIVVQEGDSLRSLLHNNPGELLAVPIYSPSGHILYNRGPGQDWNLWAIPFDLSTRTAPIDPILVAEDAIGSSISSDGTLVYLSTLESPDTQKLVWVNRTGAIINTIGSPGDDFLYHPKLSPDGRQVAVVSNNQIFVNDLERGVWSQLTIESGKDDYPAWSPESDSLVYRTGPEDNGDLVVRASDGSIPPRVLVSSPYSDIWPYWSRNGDWLTYATFPELHGLENKTGGDIWYIALTGDRIPKPFIQEATDEIMPVLSPDSRYLAYVSWRSGRQEIYVRSFPDGRNRIQISNNGGSNPCWVDGNLFYLEEGTESPRLMVVQTGTRSGFRAEKPQALFNYKNAGISIPRRVGLGGGRYFLPYTYDATLDGHRLVMVHSVSEAAPAITVVQNWYAEFKDRE